MNNPDLIVSYPGFFVSEFREDTLWLKFSGNFFHNAINFDRMDFLHDYFEVLANADEIKTVVIHSGFSESGSDEYLKFFLFECPERDLGHFGFSNTMDRYELHRFCNVIDQTILDIQAMDKMFINICSGEVLSLFMNIALACDYRIITSDTSFYNIYHEIGMLPKGGAPFILGRTVGPGQAKKLLLQDRITAQQSLENHIVDDVVVPEDLEDTVQETIVRFNDLPAQSLFGVKRLVNFNFAELKNYLAYETEQIWKIAQNKKFFDQ
nr:enoyl-CoA hydratase/isomerase family protein [uncultured Desulfobacter sp.]